MDKALGPWIQMQFSIHLTVLPEPEDAGPNASSRNTTGGEEGEAERDTHRHAAF